MDTDCTKFLVEHVSDNFDSAEHIFDPLFKFALDHQKFFSDTPIFTEDSFATLMKLHSIEPTDDISTCPSSSLFTWRADLALQYIASEFEKHQYPASTLIQYLAESDSSEILKSGVSEKPVGACLAALLFKSPLPEHIALKSRLGSELFKTLEKSKASDFVDILASAAPQELQGPENEFIRALNNIAAISNTWDHMKIADLSPNVKLTAGTSIANKLSDKEFFELYGGKYSLIPSDTPVDPNFDKLTESEQNAICNNAKAPKYVKSFLIANFPKFHQLLHKNAMTVYDQLKLSNANNFNSEAKKYSSKLSYYSSDSKTLNDIFNSIQRIPKKYNVNLLSDAVDEIVHSYIPALKRFKRSRVFNNSLASTMVSTGNNSLLLGAAVYLQTPHFDEEQTPKQPEIIQEPKYYEKYLFNCGNLYGGDSENESKETSFINPDYHAQDSLTTKHYNKLIEIQKKFNSRFIVEYRKILDILVSVPDSEFKTYDLPTLQQMIGQFNKVLIRSGETVVKLTGVEEKHLNKEYTSTCQGLIDVLNNKQINAFMPLIPVLQNIITICKETLAESTKERDEYFFAKKSPIDFDTYENLTTKLRNEYIRFTKDDSVKISDIVSRFRDFLSSKIVPKGDNNTYSRLKEYIAKLSDRTEAINRYFNDIIDTFKYHQSQQYSTSSNKILGSVVNMAITLINEHKKAYIWLNEKIDAFEINDRIKQLKNRTFTEDELEKISNAYVEFNKYIKLNANKLGNKYKTFMMYEPKNVCNFFKCYQLARETIEEIGSVNYLERLYKILGIIDTSSEEWAKFKIGLTNYLALSTIWFDVYKSIYEGTGDDKYLVWTYINKNKPAANYPELSKLNEFTELKKGRSYKLFKSLNDIITCSEGELFGDMFNPHIDKKTGTSSKYNIKLAVKTKTLGNDYTKIFTEYGTALLQIIENKTIYNPQYVIGFSMRQKKNFDPIGENKNSLFYITVLKSLYVPVLQQLDKYIRVRYTGALDLNTNISKLMMGGDSESKDSTKQEAGSVYDYTTQHFDEPQTVIPEAFKFYICGYAILKYYFSKLEEIRANESTTMSVEFNSSSNFSSLKEKGLKDNQIKLINVSANEYNLKAFLKIMNKYWSVVVGDTETKTTKAIEMICSEFNNLIVFGNIDDLRKIRDGTEHEIDLEKQSRNMQKLHDDMHKFIEEASGLIVSAGINYDILLKTELSKAVKEISTSNDKFGTLKKWIENVDKPKNVESEERRLFIDVFLSPIIIINRYWAKYFNSIVYLPKFMKEDTDTTKKTLMNLFSKDELKPFISSLIKYGKYSSKTAGDIIKLSLQEYYEDMDSAIHHIIGYKGFTEQSVKLLVEEVHDKFKQIYDQIIKFFSTKDFEKISSSDVLKYINISVPAFSNDYIERNVFKKGLLYNDSYIKFSIEGFDNIKTFTQFVCVALSRLSNHKYLPQYFVDALKQSELLNNTFSEIRSMGSNPISLFAKLGDKPVDRTYNKCLPYSDEIIDVITSALIYWSSSQLAAETDSKIANQTYKNKIVSTVPLLLYILDTIYKRIDEHHEEYIICTSTVSGNKTGSDTEGPKNPSNDSEGIDKNINYGTQTSRTIKINAKSEITILKNILKGLYAEFLPTATKMTFMNSGLVQSDHYLCEVRKLVEDDKIKFVDILENPEKFEWILPLAKVNAGVEYMEGKRFEKYLKLIEPITIDADFNKSFVAVINIMAKVLLYGIIDSLDYSMNKIEGNSFSGGLNGGSIKDNVLNVNSYDKQYDDNVIPDLKHYKSILNNPNGNLIASEINNSVSKLKSSALNYYDKKGQVLSPYQQFAMDLYSEFLKLDKTFDYKNFNIDLLIKAEILNNFAAIKDKDNKEINVDNIRISIPDIKNKAKGYIKNPLNVSFIIFKDDIKQNIQELKGGDNEILISQLKEVLVSIVKTIQVYTSKESYDTFKTCFLLLSALKYKIKHFNYTSDEFEIIKNSIRYDTIKTIKGLNIRTFITDLNIPQIKRKGVKINQFKEYVNLCIDALKKYENEHPSDDECKKRKENIEKYKDILFSNNDNDIIIAEAFKMINNLIYKDDDGNINRNNTIYDFKLHIWNYNMDYTNILNEITKINNIDELKKNRVFINFKYNLTTLLQTLENDRTDLLKRKINIINKTGEYSTISDNERISAFNFIDNIVTYVIRIHKILTLYKTTIQYLIDQNIQQINSPNYYQIYKLDTYLKYKDKDINKKLINYLYYINYSYKEYYGLIKNYEYDKEKIAIDKTWSLYDKDNKMIESMFCNSVNVSSKPLSTFYEESIDDIIKNLEDIVQDNRVLINIINNNCLWCVILAAIILKSNFGLFNKILIKQLETLSQVIYSNYATKYTDENKNIEECLNSLNKDKFIIDNDVYYNTDYNFNISKYNNNNIFSNEFIQLNKDERRLYVIYSIFTIIMKSCGVNALVELFNEMKNDNNKFSLDYFKHIIFSTNLYNKNKDYNIGNVLLPYLNRNNTLIDGNIDVYVSIINGVLRNYLKVYKNLINDPVILIRAMINFFGCFCYLQFSNEQINYVNDCLRRDDYDFINSMFNNSDGMINIRLNDENTIKKILNCDIEPIMMMILSTIKFDDKNIQITDNLAKMIKSTENEMNDTISDFKDKFNSGKIDIEDIELEFSLAVKPTRAGVFNLWKYRKLYATLTTNIFMVNKPTFIQNAFVYDPHSECSDMLADCYNNFITYIRFDKNNDTYKTPDNYIIPYNASELKSKIEDVHHHNKYRFDISDNEKLTKYSLSDIFNSFNNFMTKGINTINYEPNRYERDMNRMVGGDLYTIDSKELLKEYEKSATIYDSFIEVRHASLYTLITAYYANIILGFNVYFNKSTFIEILYNSEMFDKFFNKLNISISSYDKEIPEKLKVLIPLMLGSKRFITQPITNINETILTNQQIKDNYYNNIWNGDDVTGTYYEPSAIRRFLEMTYDPITEGNLPKYAKDKKLIKYIINCQGNKIIDIIMNFERLNLQVGALFQFIKEFEYIPMGESNENTKYTKEYRDIEMFDGKRPGDYSNEIFDGKRPTWTNKY